MEMRKTMEFHTPDDAADKICEQLGANGDKAARETAGDSWAIGPAKLTRGEVISTIDWMLEENAEMLSEESKEYLEAAKDEVPR